MSHPLILDYWPGSRIGNRTVTITCQICLEGFEFAWCSGCQIDRKCRNKLLLVHWNAVWHKLIKKGRMLDPLSNSYSIKMKLKEYVLLLLEKYQNIKTLTPYQESAKIYWTTWLKWVFDSKEPIVITDSESDTEILCEVKKLLSIWSKLTSLNTSEVESELTEIVYCWQGEFSKSSICHFPTVIKNMPLRGVLITTKRKLDELISDHQFNGKVEALWGLIERQLRCDIGKIRFRGDKNNIDLPNNIDTKGINLDDTTDNESEIEEEIRLGGRTAKSKAILNRQPKVPRFNYSRFSKYSPKLHSKNNLNKIELNQELFRLRDEIEKAEIFIMGAGRVLNYEIEENKAKRIKIWRDEKIPLTELKKDLKQHLGDLFNKEDLESDLVKFFTDSKN